MRRPRDLPSFRDLNKLVVGIVSLVLTTAVIAGLFGVGTLGLLDHTYQVAGVFAESGGLRNGAPVRIAGIQVGKVTDVQPDFRAGQVLITWKTDHGVHLGPRTRAEIGTATLLGGDFIRLYDTEGGASLESRPRDDRRIPLERTRIPYTVINAFGDVSQQVQQLDVDTFNHVIHDAADALRRNGAGLPTLVDDLAKLGGAVDARQAQLDQLIGDGAQLTTTLAKRDDQLGRLIDQAGGLLDALNRRHDEVARLLGSSSSAASRLASLLATKRASIDAIAQDIHTTLASIDRLEPQINQGLAYAGPTLKDLASAVGYKQFNIQITGIGAASLANLDLILDQLVGP